MRNSLTAKSVLIAGKVFAAFVVLFVLPLSQFGCGGGGGKHATRIGFESDG